MTNDFECAIIYSYLKSTQKIQNREVNKLTIKEVNAEMKKAIESLDITLQEIDKAIEEARGLRK